MSQNDAGAVETKVDTTTIPQAATEEPKKPVENTKADETAAPEAGMENTNEPEVDYEAELAKLEAEKNNWKQAAMDAKDKLKRKGIVEAPNEEESSEDDSAVAIIKAAVNEAVAPLREELVSNVMAETLNKISTNPSEQKLIQFHYENTINKTGVSKDAILRDLQNAQAVANQARLRKENEELKASLKNRAGMRNTSMGSNQTPVTDSVDISALKFTPMELVVIQRSAARANMSVEDYIKKNHSQG